MMLIRVGVGAALMLFAAAPADAQVTAQQQGAIRSNCRTDFVSKCSGVTPGGKEALACLQNNVASLSPACKTAVSVTLPKPAPAAAVPASSPWPAAAPAPSPWPAPAATAQPAAPTRPSTAAAPAASKPMAPTAAKPKLPVTPKPVAAAKPSAPKPNTPAPPAAPPALAPTAEQAAAIKYTCSHDVGSLCKDIAEGTPEAFACLQRSSNKLSPDCRTSVAAVEESAAVEEETQSSASMPAPAAAAPKAPVANTAVMLRACRRDLVEHCRDVAPGGGRELACLAAHEQSLTVRCKMARRVTAPLR